MVNSVVRCWIVSGLEPLHVDMSTLGNVHIYIESQTTRLVQGIPCPINFLGEVIIIMLLRICKTLISRCGLLFPKMNLYIINPILMLSSAEKIH